MHYSVLVFWFGVGGLVVSLVGMFGIDDGPLFHEWDERMWILSFMVALVGILGSILMTKAVCWVTPSKVMVVRSFEVVAAYILQVTLRLITMEFRQNIFISLKYFLSFYFNVELCFLFTQGFMF